MTPSPSRSASAAPFVFAAVLGWLGGCMQTRSVGVVPEAPAVAAMAAASADQPADHPGLRNVVVYADGVYCGAAPEGDAGFASLRALGVATVLSVDGALPEVERARAQGLRYVHLPIGYDGVPEVRGRELAAAVTQLPKPIYIHCHHGKHRSAGAAATACVIAGLLSPAAAIARMQVSGTAADYAGLFASVRAAKPLPASALPRSEAFPEQARVSGTVAAMTAIDLAVDELKLARGARWQVPGNHPDLVPQRSAQRLCDLLGGLSGEPELQAQPAAFHRLLQDSVAAANALQRVLAGGETAACDENYKALQASCRQCHQIFRDRR